jgi:hypothetical protein
MPAITSCRSRSSSTDNSNQRASGAVCTRNSADIGNFRRFARDATRGDYTRRRVQAASRRAVRRGNYDPDDVPEPPAEPISKRGDLWILDQHRILCGDSTNEFEGSPAASGTFCRLGHVFAKYEFPRVTIRRQTAIACCDGGLRRPLLTCRPTFLRDCLASPLTVRNFT